MQGICGNEKIFARLLDITDSPEDQAKYQIDIVINEDGRDRYCGLNKKQAITFAKRILKLAKNKRVI